MPKVKLTLGIGIVGATRETIIDVPDEIIDQAIEDKDLDNCLYELWKEWSNDRIDGSWDLLEEKS